MMALFPQLMIPEVQTTARSSSGVRYPTHSLPNLSPSRINFFSADPKFLQSLLRALSVEFTVPSQARKRCRGDGFGVDLEVPAQMFAIVAASEAVRAQRHQAWTEPGRELIRNSLQVIGRGHDRPLRFLQRGDDVRSLRRFRRVQTVPALDGQSLAPQLSVTGHAPDIGGHVVLLREDALGAYGFVHNRTTAE